MYDVPMAELKKEIYSTRWNGVLFVEYSWQQLGLDMKWYERQCNLCSYNQEIILREIQLQRLAGSNMSPFTREQQLYLSSHKKKPIDELDVRAKDVMATLYMYEKLDRRIPYVFGIDPAEGLSEDNNALIVINPFTYKVAAEFKCPYISPKDFSKFIISFMDRYAPNALLVVESNRGRELIQRLTDSHYRTRVWYDKDRLNQLLSEKTDQYGGTPQSTLARKVQGFVTGPKSRNLLFATLEEMVMENIDCIYTENLVNEILTLIRKPTGKIEAGPGEHDDCVMAYLIGLYVYLHASNLEEYGMSRRMRAPGQTLAPEVENEKDYRRRVRSSLASIPEKYQDIFKDFIGEKDGFTDSRDYAREIARAQAEADAIRERMEPGTYDEYGAESIPFDQQAKVSREPQKLGMKFHQMGAQHQVFNGRQRDDGFIISDSQGDIWTDEDREGFDSQILRNNFFGREGYDFDPDDYV